MRVKVLLKLSRFKIPLEPIGHVEEEFVRLIKEGCSFIPQVLSEGKISLLV